MCGEEDRFRAPWSWAVAAWRACTRSQVSLSMMARSGRSTRTHSASGRSMERRLPVVGSFVQRRRFQMSWPAYRSFRNIEWSSDFDHPGIFFFVAPSAGAVWPASPARMAISDSPRAYRAKMPRTTSASWGSMTWTARGCSGSCGSGSGTVR